MKIRLDKFWIVGGPDELIRTHQQGLSIVPQRSVQPVPGLRTPHAKLIDRGNVTYNISFSVHRYHADVKAAEYYCLAHWNQMPGNGKLMLQAENYDGTVIKRYFNVSSVMTCTNRYRGRTTIHDYSVMATEFINKKI